MSAAIQKIEEKPEFPMFTFFARIVKRFFHFMIRLSIGEIGLNK
jgi:hypothetical protein